MTKRRPDVLSLPSPPLPSPAIARDIPTALLGREPVDPEIVPSFVSAVHCMLRAGGGAIGTTGWSGMTGGLAIVSPRFTPS
ncbi:hypothetical protein SAMN05444166_7701 [Singulisphaera sp. GP187]|nr:hypothetical protein SAMN05444166_7701 [Singulisphaera sp. GP187]